MRNWPFEVLFDALAQEILPLLTEILKFFSYLCGIIVISIK